MTNPFCHSNIERAGKDHRRACDYRSASHRTTFTLQLLTTAFWLDADSCRTADLCYVMNILILAFTGLPEIWGCYDHLYNVYGGTRRINHQFVLEFRAVMRQLVPTP